jgi:3-phenylpropionate/trans-cinnamate dioxygenase ferredoxin reductase subunit
MTHAPCIVIVGAGQAGARAALALRARGWDGRVLLVGEEPHAPYERPPLSKQALLAHDAAATLVAEPGRYEEQRIELRLRTRATALDTARRTVTLETEGGVTESVRYHKLLLATGGRARRLDIPGALDERVMTLRHAGDAARLAARLGAGATVAVLGGGFIGLEVAAAARQRGSAVVLLEAGPRLLGRAVPESIAALVHALHASRGVDIRLGDAPVAFQPAPDHLVVRCASGRGFAVDTVVVGIGMAPEVSLARAAGLTVRRGIVVDRRLATGAEHVYAAGDACEFPGGEPGDGVVMESWANAEAQAQVVAGNLLGGDEPYRPATWMWSDQYDHALQMAGTCGGAAGVATRPLPGGRLDFHLDADQRIVGAAGFAPVASLARAFLLARRLVEARAQRSPADLADPERALKSLLAA